jgi:hypothetical protein
MAETQKRAVAVVGIDIGKNSFHIVGLDGRGAIVLRQRWSRGQVEVRFANMPPCLIGMEACVGAHHLSRRLQALGHDARLMPAKYVRPYSKGQKNDFRDAEAIAHNNCSQRFITKQKPSSDYATTLVRDTGRPEVYFAFKDEADARKSAAAMKAVDHSRNRTLNNELWTSRWPL